MTEAALSLPRLQAREYLELERQASNKHEFADGIMYAMAGAGRNHNLIVTDIVGAFLARLKAPCQIFGADMKVQVRANAAEHYFYPDAHVSCSDLDNAELFNSQPILIVEVASESTEYYDRGEKFGFYRLLPSLQEYVIVQQVTPLIEVFRRRTTWQPEAYRMTDTVRFESVELSVPVSAFYARVNFGPQA